MPRCTSDPDLAHSQDPARELGAHAECTPRISIIVLNWNGGTLLARCLAALAEQTLTDFEVIVVDNGSSDGSVLDLEHKWPALALRVERLPCNVGFAAANNLGARLARGHWIALLNNDAFAAPDWLEALINATLECPSFSFFASRLIRADDHSRLDGAGDVYHVSGLSWRRYHNLSAEQLGAKPEEVFSPCAAAALYPRDAFLSLGGFDEDFFSTHEDADLGFRLRLAGFRCLYVPSALAYHMGSATIGERSTYAIYHGHRNLVWSYVKNMPSALFWRYFLLHVAANLFYLAYFSLRGHGGAIWRAKIDAVRGIPKILRKRRDIQRNRKVSAVEISRVLEHDWHAPLREFLARW